MQAIKTVGSSGQISLGKEYAGQTVLVEELEHGVWIIKAGRFIPDNELWAHEHTASDAINRALEWDRTHNRQDSDLDELERRINSQDGSTRPE